jgi:ubiquitin C-terminal hydrolase
VTDALAALLQHLWFGSAPAVDARALKRAIDASTDSFAGLAQHDSAEFLNYVLDMVHEDLNRVTQRVYVEIPDPGARPDAEVADELWQLHTKRNDSVVQRGPIPKRVVLRVFSKSNLNMYRKGPMSRSFQKANLSR